MKKHNLIPNVIAQVSTKISVTVLSVLFLTSCSKKVDESIPEPQKIKTEKFSVADAQANLSFAKDQYLKMISHIENNRNLHFRPACKERSEMICIPRSEEHGVIFMDKYEKWTNGFFPGLMWKLLANNENITWATGEEQKMYNSAKHFQQALKGDATLDNTHDLGFMLYDSYGEALNYHRLDEQTRQQYLHLLDIGRETLASRYTDEKGVIKSWDFIPNMKLTTIENGEQKVGLYSLSNPWTYPVIIDNMMNLEYLLDSDVKRYHEIALNHAKTTLANHYFFDEVDTAKQYPLSYHVFDYGANKPGNWQGVGNISAWARGQGWSLYGFLTVVEAMEKSKIDLANAHHYPDFNAHLQRLLGSIEHLLKDDYIPYWDFFATRDNAAEYAENVSPDTAIYSGILELCSKRLEEHITPYKGYRPQKLNASILSKESIELLQGKKNWYGEDVLQDDKLIPCGSKPYPKSHKKIPRDTSAAAIYASALYRYATITLDETAKVKYSALADNIMAELSSHYRTDRNNTRPHSFDYGFVLAEATGDMGNAGEIDTPIVYGDFYFVEANIRKIKYEKSNKK